MVLLSVVVATTVLSSQAEYDVVFLHQNGVMRTSLVKSSSNGIHAGMVGIGFAFNAAIWKGSSPAYEIIGPSGVDSRIWGSFGDYQIGNTDPGERATLWQSSLSSHALLTPIGSSLSRVHSIQGDQIVGSVRTSGQNTGRASLWLPTGRIDLHPGPTYSESSAETTDGIYQYGFAVRPGGSGNGFRWKGTAASAEVFPVGVIATRNGQIITSKMVSGIGFMVGIWTPASFVPFGVANVTEVTSTSGTYQCGYVRGGNNEYLATAWEGTPESKVNLHALLPSEYVESFAYCVDEDGNVYGHAAKFVLSAEQNAVIWKRRGASTTLVPARYSVTTGSLAAGQLGDMLWSNDTYLEALPSFAGARLDPNITIQTEHPSGVTAGSALRIRLESGVTAPGIERTIQVFNWTTGAWDLVDLGVAQQADELQEVVVNGGLQNYFGNLGVRVRMNWRATSAAGNRTWRAKLDNVRVVIDP